MRRLTRLTRSTRARRCLCAGAVFFAFFACGRVQLHGAQPQALLDARSLDFGATPLLFPVQRLLRISDGGRVALQVTQVQISGAPFEVAPAPLLVAAGQTVQLPVLFRPAAQGAFAGTLTLATDDPDQPTIAVALIGVGTAPGGLSVRPAALDFGRVGEGEAATRELDLTSTGPADLYLAGFGFGAGTPDAFGYAGSVKAPAQLAAGASLRLAVRFAPTPGTATAAGALAIDSSDPSQPRLLVPLSGSINRAPLAVATGAVPPQAPKAGSLDAAVGATVLLDGSGSSDPDGDLPLRFTWTLAARPAESAAIIGSPAAARATLPLDVPGIYSVLLSVNDATGLASFTPARLDLRAAPAERLVVQLVWDQVPPDLDLHFLEAGAPLESAGDCYWANPNPAFVAGTADQNPHHLGDRLTGYGPETVSWKQPAPGTYSLAVSYQTDHGAARAATAAQIRVYADGVLVADLSHTMASVGEVWSAGTVQWPSGHVSVAP